MNKEKIMRKMIAGLLTFFAVSTFADTLVQDLKEMGDQQIQDRKEQIARVKTCSRYKSQLEGILYALSADAQFIAADATGARDVQRVDEIAYLYRQRMPIHAKELSKRLTELAEATSMCIIDPNLEQKN